MWLCIPEEAICPIFCCSFILICNQYICKFYLPEELAYSVEVGDVHFGIFFCSFKLKIAFDTLWLPILKCKVEASEDLLRPIRVGESSSLKVGQQCLAIGNPFGFDHTLTVGVLSGLNRDIYSQTGVTISGGIQTDAAINPGNRFIFLTLYFPWYRMHCLWYW